MNDHPVLVERGALLAGARDALGRGEGVLLYGPAGIGKTAVLLAVAADYEADGHRVLRTSPGPAETSLPHVALLDLLRDAFPEAAPALDEHLRKALAVALLHGDPGPGPDADPLAVRVAALETLRHLSAARPLLLTVDDAQWLDPASREVLEFAARRLSGHPVRVLAAERTDPGRQPEATALCPPPAAELAVHGLSAEGLDAVLRSRIGLRLPPPLVARLHTVAEGNPYFTMELGRALQQRGVPSDPGEPLPVPDRLRTLLHHQLTALDPAHLPLLVAVAAAARPTWDVLPAHTDGARAALEPVLATDADGGVAFAHPMLAELVYQDASADQRRAAHAHLAEAVDDAVEAARHRALAGEGPDVALAAQLEEAAALARRRGAPVTAARLLRTAAARTPPDAPEQAGRRMLEAAHDAVTGGLTDFARACCRELLAMGPPAPGRPTRVRARLLLAHLDGPDSPDTAALLAAAAHDAGDDPLLAARVRHQQAVGALHRADIPGGMRDLAAAEALARRTGEEDLLLDVLFVKATVTMQSDPSGAEELLDEGRRLSADAATTSEAAVLLRCGWISAQLRRGQMERAARGVEELRAQVEAAGRTRDLTVVLQMAASVHERAGRCRESHTASRSASRLREAVDPTPGAGLTMLGASELCTGDAETACRILTEAVGAAETAHDTEWTAYSSGLLGRAHAVLGRTERAAAAFRRCRGLLDDLGFTDPALFLVDADLAEALAATGATSEAATVLNRARTRAEQLGRTVVELGLRRAEAVLRAAGEGPAAAADALRTHIPPEHPYPLELARARLTLGQLEAQARRRAAARAALEEALEQYEGAHNHPWAERVRHELRRLDGGRDDATPISPLEADIVDLVRSGATNRQIAARLHLSIKTVEANLTRLYRRFDLHNRNELARSDLKPSAAGDAAVRTSPRADPTPFPFAR